MMTTPLVDLATLDDVKGYLGVSQVSANDDPLLKRLITSASAYIRNYTTNDITTQTVTEWRKGNGRTNMALRNTPITDVASVTINGISVPNAMDDVEWATGYIYDSNFLYLRGFIFEKGMRNVKVVYTGGYADPPVDIVQACCEIVALIYRRRSWIGQSSKGMAGETTSFIQKEVAPETLATLKRYNTVVPIV